MNNYFYLKNALLFVLNLLIAFCLCRPRAAKRALGIMGNLRRSRPVWGGIMHTQLLNSQEVGGTERCDSERNGPTTGSPTALRLDFGLN